MLIPRAAAQDSAWAIASLRRLIPAPNFPGSDHAAPPGLPLQITGPGHTGRPGIAFGPVEDISPIGGATAAAERGVSACRPGAEPR